MSFRPALLEHSCPDVLLASHTHIIWDALLSHKHAPSLHSMGGHSAHPPRDTLCLEGVVGPGVQGVHGLCQAHTSGLASLPAMGMHSGLCPSAPGNNCPGKERETSGHIGNRDLHCKYY